MRTCDLFHEQGENNVSRKYATESHTKARENVSESGDDDLCRLNVVIARANELDQRGYEIHNDPP